MTTIEIREVDPEDPRAAASILSYFTELSERMETGFDPNETRPLDADALRPPRGLFLLATRDGESVGCGGLKLHPDDGGAWAEIKRVWVSPAARGQRLASRLLDELEAAAVDHGATVVRLDTNKALVEAIAMYRARGYAEIPAFNDEKYAHFWFEKRL